MKTYMCVELLGPTRLPNFELTMLAFFRLIERLEAIEVDSHIDVCWAQTPERRCACSSGRPWGEFVLTRSVCYGGVSGSTFLRELTADALSVVCGQFKDAWMLLHGIEPSCAHCITSTEFFQGVKYAQLCHDNNHDSVIEAEFLTFIDPASAYDEYLALSGVGRSVRNPYKG